MEASIVLVSGSVAVRDAMERVLARTHTSVHHERSVDGAAETASRLGSLVICTLEVDWRRLISLLNGAGEIGPPVIILLPAADSRLWAEALLAGVFDAILMTDAPEQVLETMAKARARWERARLVRDALRQNSMLWHVA